MVKEVIIVNAQLCNLLKLPYIILTDDLSNTMVEGPIKGLCSLHIRNNNLGLRH
jgi:hypothetical protein